MAMHELISSAILFVWLVKDAKIYDFATVATFTSCLVLLHRQKLMGFLLVFVLACLNRETAFLLIVFFAVHFFGRMERKTYLLSLIAQILIFLSIRLAMLVSFRNNPGVNAQFNLFKNFQEFAGSPIATLIVILVFVGVIWLMARHWQATPAFLRKVVLTFTPLLCMMWILFGRAFELRVFIELFPVLYVIIVAEKRPHLTSQASDL
jgi:hypothetical protein